MTAQILPFPQPRNELGRTAVNELLERVGGSREERVALLRGALHIDSAPDEGTSVRVTVPLSEAGSRKSEVGSNGGHGEGLAG